MNPNFPQPVLFRKKAQSYQARWDWLRVIEPKPDCGLQEGFKSPRQPA
ncbi:hypothetical protein SAMN05216197_101183 [Pseudomonas graminis]|uniref:Uncharacterized protein n=2 Tax=Pseudomonas graminis TaxID=158627 RepID=A0A1H9YDI0_9PSED|nr:hypothetical protein SAMN05216197_101183 [Pseudomonas graminis]